ncbi:MAG: prepilin peptidase [Caulobacterales bacterium]|jgi:leader peptidase (prepilin peptidase)/N-methyltransferase
MAPFDIALLIAAGPAGILAARAAAAWPNWRAALAPAGVQREVGVGLLMIAAATLSVFGLPSPWALAGVGLAVVLLFAALVDLRTHLIPDVASIGLTAAGLAFAFWQGGVETLSVHALAAAVGFCAFWAIGALYHRWRNVDGLGLGDAKLLAAGGAWCGLTGLAWIVCAGAFVTLLFAWRRPGAAPFAPGLAAAIFGVWWLGPSGLGAFG